MYSSCRLCGPNPKQVTITKKQKTNALLKNTQLHNFLNLNLQETQSAFHVTLQKEDNRNSAYAGLIYSQLYIKGLFCGIVLNIKIKVLCKHTLSVKKDGLTGLPERFVQLQKVHHIAAVVAIQRH